MFLFVQRYLFAKKSHSVVNIITALSLVSISLPVAAVIILLSVFNGFGEWAYSASTFRDADITVMLSQGSRFEIDDIDTEAISAVEGIDAFSMVLEQTMLLENDDRQAVVTLRGVDSAFVDVVPLDSQITKGEYQVALGELDRVVIGYTLARRLGATNIIGQFLNLYSLKQSGFSSLLPMSNYNKREIKVAGLYTTDAQSEERYALTSLRAVQNITSSEGKATHIFVKLDQGASSQQTIGELRELLGDEFEVKDRYALNPMYYDIIAYEKWGLLFISMLIMLLASFTLIGALSMLITEKRGDISTLRAMGGTWQFIRNIFFGEGLLISAVGVALGALLGSAVTILQEFFGLVKIPAQSFMMQEYPVQLLLSDVVIVAVLSLVISVALSYIVVRQMIKNK